jgi:hypothetical protein
MADVEDDMLRELKRFERGALVSRRQGEKSRLMKMRICEGTRGERKIRRAFECV